MSVFKKGKLGAITHYGPDGAVASGQPEDAVIGFGTIPTAPAGCLAIGFTPEGAAWSFNPPSDDAFVRQELVETLTAVAMGYLAESFGLLPPISRKTER